MVILLQTLHLESHMAETKQAATKYVVPYLGKSLSEMTGGEKITWLSKAVIMICTGGFAFPNIFVE